MKAMGIVLIVTGIFMIIAGFSMYTNKIPMVESQFGKYVIEQDVQASGDYVNLAEFPRVNTHIWHNESIVKSWYDHIESDSTAGEARQRAEEWIKMIKENENAAQQ
jgi:Ni,Fe-hydrogenase I cytochrome b subunit